jgi:hypothetical protein
MNVAHDKSNRFFLSAIPIQGIGSKLSFKAHDAEVPPAGGKIGFGELADCGLGAHLGQL